MYCGTSEIFDETDRIDQTQQRQRGKRQRRTSTNTCAPPQLRLVQGRKKESESIAERGRSGQYLPPPQLTHRERRKLNEKRRIYINTNRGRRDSFSKLHPHTNKQIRDYNNTIRRHTRITNQQRNNMKSLLLVAAQLTAATTITQGYLQLRLAEQYEKNYGAMKLDLCATNFKHMPDPTDCKNAPTTRLQLIPEIGMVVEGSVTKRSRQVDFGFDFSWPVSTKKFKNLVMTSQYYHYRYYLFLIRLEPTPHTAF